MTPMRYNGGGKEEVMPKRSRSQQVPKEMQARFDEITQITDAFSQEYLNEEYSQICRELTAALCRKRPSPLVAGKINTWVCGIIHAVGTVNFLFDSTEKPYVASSQICAHFGLSASTMQAKSKQIRDLFGMYQMDPDWTLPSMIDQNPLVWTLQVNGIIMDARYAPREIQEVAFMKGLIPYIPEK